jgi:hypothetical protein
MDMSQHSTHHETVHIISNLDELERKLFGVGQLSFRSYKVSLYRLLCCIQHLFCNQNFFFHRSGYGENPTRSTQLL